MKSRGLVLAFLFVLSTSFMLTDKSRVRMLSQEQLSLQDELIRSLSLQVPDPKTEIPFAAASQWPGRTMIACKCMVFPLPPPMPDQEQLLASIKGITHLVFDPYDPKNRSLGRQIAELSGVTQTIALQEAGTVIKMRPPADDTETNTAHTNGFAAPAAKLNDLPNIPEHQ